MIEWFRKNGPYKSSADVAGEWKNPRQNVQPSHKPASTAQLKDPAWPQKWTSALHVVAFPRRQPKAGTEAVCVASSPAAETGTNTQTKARVSTTSRAWIPEQVAQSHPGLFHWPENAEKTRRGGERSIIAFVSFQTTNSNPGSRRRLRWNRHPAWGTPTLRWDWFCYFLCAWGCRVLSVPEHLCHNCLVLKQLCERIASVLIALCPCLMKKEEHKQLASAILSWCFSRHGRDKSTCDVSHSDDPFLLSL